MKALAGCLLALLVALQWRLWFGEGSVQEVARLVEEARAARAEVVRLQGRERALAAEVADLKSGLDAVEERARTELGMLDEHETFFRFVRAPGAGGDAPDGAGAAGAAPLRRTAGTAVLPEGDGDVEVVDAAAARAATSDVDGDATGDATGDADGDASVLGASGTIRRTPRVE